ncbi:MAG TPA: carbohydrate binding domain-containing protein, partial [Bacteroidales bacterium]|nr:carbohydrate binding domain-containing protein [Bacteroidales bacterium]
MKRFFLLLTAGILFSVVIYGQAFQNGFDFTLPYNDTTLGEFLPQFPEGPITDDDFVSTDGQGSFIVNGKPYRFFGVNLVSQGAFPSKEDAAVVAGRMRKYGINLVRFHHMDNPWSDGSLFYGTNGTRSLNLDNLDRLDYFIYQLKKQGIYVNMNLNVSRTFKPSDGVVDADSLSDYAKGLTQFDPVMISLEKEYAEMLLGHTNTYTGMSLAHDPVLAVVEIINENTLFRMWYSGNLRPIANGGTLPVYYNNMLDSLWNDFLLEKYGTTSALANAWNQDLITGDTLFKDGFEDGMGNEWVVELHNTAMATATINSEAATGSSAALVTITSTSDADWHTKFKYVGASVKKDSVYEVLIKAKADEIKGITISFQRENSPWTFYNGFDIMLDTVYREYKVSFKAPEDNTGYLRVGISFMNKTGQFWFDDFVFKKQSTTGLNEGETLESRNISRVGYNEIASYSKMRVSDMTEFYAKVQSDFLTGMKDFLTGPLGVIAPLTGTNWFTGPEDVYVQNTLDYIDNHAYWDHPSFPNTPWSTTDWTINNTPVLTSESGIVENLFNGLSVINKPYTISEYNHAYPNQYQAEMLPLITSYLSFNDADGLMIFDYSGSWNFAINMISGYFDIHRNTSLMGSFPVFSYAFRHNLIKPASETIEIKYSHKDIMKMPFSVRNSWSAHYPYDYKLGYTHHIALSFDNVEDADLSGLPVASSSPYSFDDSQLYWDKDGLFKIDAEKFSSITGYLDQFTGASNRMMTVSSGSGFGG